MEHRADGGLEIQKKLLSQSKRRVRGSFQNSASVSLVALRPGCGQNVLWSLRETPHTSLLTLDRPGGDTQHTR